MTRDTNKSERAEELLRESEARLKRAEKLARMGHYSFEADHGNAIWSDGLKDLWGFDRDSNPTWDDLMARIHPDDRERILAEYNRRVKERQGFEFEYRIERPDGSESIVHSLGEATIDPATGRLRYFGTMVDITARETAEAAVRKSEVRLQRVINATNDGVWDWNKITKKSCRSPRWKEIFGYLDHELSDEEDVFFSRVHPDDLLMHKNALALHMETGAPLSSEIRIRHKDGSYHWALIRGESVRDAQGVVIGMSGTTTDITERKLAVEAIQHERNRLRQILDSQFAFVAVLTLDGVIVEINQMPLTLMGLSRGDVLGRILLEIAWLDPSAVPKVQAALAAAARGETLRDEIIALFPGVGRRNVEVIWSPMRDAAGKVTNVVGFGVDITERVQMEQALRSSEELFRTLAKIAPVGIFRTDSAGNCIYVNEHYCEISGLTQQESLGNGWTASLHPGDRDRIFKQWIQTVKNREPLVSEMRLLRPDGQLVWVVTEARAETDLKGKVLGYVGTVTDITARKLAELRIAASLQEKDTLLREVHHRVKNNLQIISSLLYFQAKKARTTHEMQGLREGEDRLRAMILVHEQLYRSEDLHSIKLGEYVGALARQLQRSFSDVSNNIRIGIEADEVTVAAETALPCGMIITELVTNAIKYAYPGGKGGHVRVRIAKEDAGFTLSVTDSGVGMPEGFNLALTETFGLKLVQNLAEQLNATLTLVPGKGTAISLHVPQSPVLGDDIKMTIQR